MKENNLSIQINKPVSHVFSFTITPPNSAKWIPGVIYEETNELPVKVGTIYTLKTKNSQFKVIVSAMEKDHYIEWTSEDHNLHIRYTYKAINKSSTNLEYSERVDNGELDDPFILDILRKLKSVLEN